MEPGRIIEFIEGRKFMTALVTRVKGSKLNILSEADKELSIPAGRVLHESSTGLNSNRSRLDLVRVLKEISERRRILSEEVKLSELWELLEGEGAEFTYRYLAELVWADVVDDDRVAAVLRTVFADGLLFKMRPEFAERLDAERVEQITRERAKEEERERMLTEGGAWLSGVWEDEPGDEPEFRDHMVRVIRDMALHDLDAPEYKWGKQLLERAGLAGDPWNPFHLMVKLGEMGLHENLDLERYQIQTKFTNEALAEAERLAKSRIWENEPRRDLTDMPLITADSGGARDFDDAVSLEVKGDHLTLGVHIADVSALVLPDTILDLTARERATSIYMPDRRITMLPEILSEEALSLRQGEVRPAFSMLADLTEAGEIISFEFFPSLVTVKRQLTYQEVDASVEHDLELKRMYELSEVLKKKRVENGALILPLPKLNVYLTPDGEIGVNLTMWENPGRSMIGEFMILANHMAARRLMEQGAPCLYRSQKPPSALVAGNEPDCNDLYVCLKQRRHLSRVNWGLAPEPHSGMGLDVYTNLTSPLRRYIDLIIQRQVRSKCGDQPPFYSNDTLSAILIEVDADLKKAARVQNNRRKYWLLRYLDGAGRKDYEALVLEKHPFRYRIFLPELMMDADLPVRKERELAPGETVMVKIKKVSPREEVLRFDLV